MVITSGRFECRQKNFLFMKASSLQLFEAADSWLIIDRHTTEGPDDMPAHIRAALTQTHLTIPLLQGKCALGIWQGIYLFEHRTSAPRRKIILHLLGET